MEEVKKLEFPDMLKELKTQIRWKITLRENSRMVYRPVNGSYYNEMSLNACKMEVRDYFKYATPTTVANLTLSLLEDSDRLFDDALFLESRKRIVGFENEVFDLQTGQVRAYGATDFVCDPLPHRVLKGFKPETEKWFLGVLSQWVGKDCAEWFCDLLAYLLFIHPNDEQLWVNFFGIGSNGKSVCLELLDKILGDKKCIGCDLRNINRFSGDTFQHKWLVIGRDSSSYVSDKATSFIKAFSGEPKLSVEEKGVGKGYDVMNQGKLIVSTNTLIQSKDRTFSWYRRIFPVPFPNTFDRDESFKRKLFRKLPQIIRFLLHRAYLYRTNKIPLSKYIPVSVQHLIRETKHYNDRVAAYWELYFFKDVERHGVTTSELDMEKVTSLHGLTMTQVYSHYSDWHEKEFGEMAVEPSLRTFGGQYGAFLSGEAGQYFQYRKTMYGRVVELLPKYQHGGNTDE